jgi:hypothetical protein
MINNKHPGDSAIQLMKSLAEVKQQRDIALEGLKKIDQTELGVMILSVIPECQSAFASDDAQISIIGMLTMLGIAQMAEKMAEWHTEKLVEVG